MVKSVTSKLLSENVQVLKSEVTKTAYQGVGIAIVSIVVATTLLCFYHTGTISVSGLVDAQRNNFALWILDALPFIFGFWGQYSSSIIAYQASALIMDQTNELRLKADNLEKQAAFAETHDGLTGLPNRGLFYDRVEQSILQADQQDRLLSILLIEVGNFKEVYDTLGRKSSDQVIKQIALRLQGLVTGIDSLARIDSNIFSVLLSEPADKKQAEWLAKHALEVLEPAFTINRLPFIVHINIGIVHFPIHGEDVDSLVQKAGVALYIASDSHTGMATYESSFDAHSPRRLTLMSELRHAISRGELVLFYQPKVDIQSNVLFGAEALVRWNHPKHGFVPPDEFIPMAEQTRMMKDLTLWVLREAFQHCALWRSQGKALTISVNLSAKDLHDTELPDLVAGIAVSEGVKPEWVILEITESSIMTDPELTLEVIERLHNMGYQLSIDDFGTGYSSLAYLKKMPLVELKIDKSFIEDILTSENDDVIVKATINLAHNLGFHVTAEGVETKDVLEKIKPYGCDIVQGYYFSKPLSASDFETWTISEMAKFSITLPG